MKVKPREGVLVRRVENPALVIPPEGGRVPMNSYYRRRLRDGDLILINEDPVSHEVDDLTEDED